MSNFGKTFGALPPHFERDDNLPFQPIQGTAVRSLSQVKEEISSRGRKGVDPFNYVTGEGAKRPSTPTATKPPHCLVV